jgi:CP family cyanate transporter-like MFS transporter
MTPRTKDLVPLTLLWLSGAALRLTILAVPPLILPIRDELGLSATGIGILTGLPVAMFALAALPGSLLIARLGSRAALLCGLLVVTVGGAARGVAWDAITLYAATIVMGAGVAAMQPAMPVLVREWLPGRIGFATAIYTNGLIVGEIAPIWVMPAVLAAAGGSWRIGLAIWSLPVLLTAFLIIAQAPEEPAGRARNRSSLAWWPDWKNPLIVRLGVLFGSVNAAYFASNAFLPPLLKSLGREELVQPALLALNLGQLPASLAILAVAKKLERRAWPYLALGTGLVICVAGVVFIAGTSIVMWAGLLGFSVASGLILGLTLPPLLAAPEDVGRTSAAMFTVSYAMSMALSLLCGAISDLTGDPAWAFAPVALCALILSASALALRASGRLI